MFFKYQQAITRVLSHKVVRYLFSGGFSALVDILVFNFCWIYLFHKSSFHFLGFVTEGYSSSLVISYTCGSLTSFFLNKFSVFGVQIQGLKQFIKSLPVYSLAFFGNWILLKIGIEWFHFLPLVSRILAALMVAFLTFNLHKYFTFSRNS